MLYLLGGKMNYNILTIFPELITTFANTGFIKNAINSQLININTINIRDYSEDVHQRVDDKVYGGGPGMILKYPPIDRAIKDIKKKGYILYLSPQGTVLNQKKLKKLSQYENLTLYHNDKCAKKVFTKFHIIKLVKQNEKAHQYIIDRM